MPFTRTLLLGLPALLVVFFAALLAHGLAPPLHSGDEACSQTKWGNTILGEAQRVPLWRGLGRTPQKSAWKSSSEPTRGHVAPSAYAKVEARARHPDSCGVLRTLPERTVDANREPPTRLSCRSARGG